MAAKQTPDGSELEFFGVRLKVKNAHLAALLNSDVTDDVQVVGLRARDVLKAGDEARAEREVALRVRSAGDRVTLRVDEVEDS